MNDPTYNPPKWLQTLAVIAVLLVGFIMAIFKVLSDSKMQSTIIIALMIYIIYKGM